MYVWLVCMHFCSQTWWLWTARARVHVTQSAAAGTHYRVKLMKRCFTRLRALWERSKLLRPAWRLLRNYCAQRQQLKLRNVFQPPAAPPAALPAGMSVCMYVCMYEKRKH